MARSQSAWLWVPRCPNSPVMCGQAFGSLSHHFLDKWMGPAWEVLRQGLLNMSSKAVHMDVRQLAQEHGTGRDAHFSFFHPLIFYV